MPLFNIELGDFPGLDLRDAVDEQGGAIDILNCELDLPGRLRSRDGYSKVTASAGASRYDSVFPIATATAITGVTNFAPGTLADDSGHGTVAWTSPTSLPSSIAMASGLTSHYLKATNFGFSVPGTATIVGITLEISRGGGPTVGGIRDESVRILKAGSLVGTDKSTGAVWSSSDPGAYFGGSSDLWGTTWTPAQVNASTFGFEFAVRTVADAAGSVTAFTVTVYYQPTGNSFVAGAAASRLDVIAVDGTVSATVATASDTRSTYAAFGSPTTSSTYIANSGTTIRKLSGTTFSTPAGMPKAKYVAVQSPDNRLVAANVNVIPTGANSTASTSLVHFSDAGAPETWSANNYVYVTPGDNEDIQGIIAWRDLVFVFKSTKFFVFYGNSTDTSGNPVFNYRPVTGAGMAAPLAVTASPDGVYFLDRRGVYYTTGGPPQRVSTTIDPLFLGGSVPFFQPGTLNPSALTGSSMAWFSGRLYLSVALGVSATNSHILVFDPTTGNWLVWDIPMGAMAASATQPGVLLFTYASGTNDVGQYAPNAYTTDAGTSISARYRSSYIPLDWRGRNLRSGIHGVDKIVRESMVDGSGTITYTIGNQWELPASLPTARTLTLGTAPQVLQARDRTAIKGRSFSWQITGTAPWSVEGVVWGIHGYEPSGVKGDEGN